MNERIKALAEQAGFKVNWQHEDVQAIKMARFEKFAELIIQECMEQVRGEYLPVLEDTEMMKDTHWDGYVQCGVDSFVAIREHFYGVEE